MASDTSQRLGLLGLIRPAVRAQVTTAALQPAHPPIATVSALPGPHDDRAFLADAQRAVAEGRETIGHAERLLAHVQTRLRERYPRVRIQPREDLASVNHESPQVWYCYRDGGYAA